MLRQGDGDTQPTGKRFMESFSPISAAFAEIHLNTSGVQHRAQSCYGQKHITQA